MHESLLLKSFDGMPIPRTEVCELPTPQDYRGMVVHLNGNVMVRMAENKRWWFFLHRQSSRSNFDMFTTLFHRDESRKAHHLLNLGTCRFYPLSCVFNLPYPAPSLTHSAMIKSTCHSLTPINKNCHVLFLRITYTP